ncbi:unnamed protein product [Amoebophrya sp. A120]|nr:unnamed protein product [Amoebophrya sp. A120]|eukprot:GSA120T00020336001.1
MTLVWTRTHEAMFAKVFADVKKEAAVILGLKTLRVTAKCDVFRALCYSALSSNGAPQYPYFRKAAKIDLEELVANKLKAILNIPKKAPSTVVFEASGLLRPHLMILIENVMLFFRGKSQKEWEIEGDTLDSRHEKYGKMNSMTNPVAFDPIKEKRSTIMRTISSDRMHDIHEAVCKYPMKITKRPWNGVRLYCETMDDIGKKYGYDSLSLLKNEQEKTRARLMIAKDHEKETRETLKSQSGLIICTDGSANKEGQLGGGGGATWWWSQEVQLNTPIRTVNPMRCSTCAIKTPLRDMKVDSFDTERYALNTQLNRTAKKVVEFEVSEFIEKVEIYLDPNSVLEGLQNFNEKSNVVLFFIVQQMELLRNVLMQRKCKYGLPPERPSINPEREVIFRAKWTPGHADMYFNDTADYLAGAALRRYQTAVEQGLDMIVYMKEITPTILRRLITNRVKYWKGPKQQKATAAPHLVERGRHVGPFRPKNSVFPSRLLEMYYFYLWSGIVPHNVMGAGVGEHGKNEQGEPTYTQKCFFCNTKNKTHATHLLLSCQVFKAERKHFFECEAIEDTLENERKVLDKPRLVCKFLLEANKRKQIFKDFAKEEIEKNVEKVAELMTPPEKIKLHMPNAFEQTGVICSVIRNEI